MPLPDFDSAWRSLAVSLVLTLLLHPVMDANAQVADAKPPAIVIEAVKEAPAARSQVFTATITEEGELEDVTLYYRRKGQVPYTAIPMQPIAGSNYFSAKVDTDIDDLRAFEYYIQARDAKGNRSVSGYAFEPIIRELLPASDSTAGEDKRTAISRTPNDSQAAPDPLVKPESKSGSGIKTWHIVLGVLATGAVIAATSDSDSSSSENTVPLTINVGEF